MERIPGAGRAMKRSWIPAALMGALAIGYLVGQGGGGSRVEVPPPVREPPAAPSSVVLPAPMAPVQPPPIEPPPRQVPTPPADDRYGAYPAWNGVDLNCPDVGHPVRIIDGYDPHGLDRDGDGIGCDG